MVGGGLVLIFCLGINNTLLRPTGTIGFYLKRTMYPLSLHVSQMLVGAKEAFDFIDKINMIFE